MSDTFAKGDDLGDDFLGERQAAAAPFPYVLSNWALREGSSLSLSM